MSSADGTQSEPTDAELDLLFRLAAEPYPGPKWEEFYLIARQVVPKLEPLIRRLKRQADWTKPVPGSAETIDKYEVRPQAGKPKK